MCSQFKNASHPESLQSTWDPQLCERPPLQSWPPHLNFLCTHFLTLNELVPTNSASLPYSYSLLNTTDNIHHCSRKSSLLIYYYKFLLNSCLSFKPACSKRY